MNYKDLTIQQKDRLIELLALNIARTSQGCCSELMYVKNGGAIDRVTDLFKDRIDKETDMNSYSQESKTCEVTEEQVINKFISLRASAKHRKLEFNLSLLSVRNLLRGERCFYTGKILSKEYKSVDRVDSSKGYVKGNVVLCDVRLNKLKADLNILDIEKMIRKMKLCIDKRKS